MTEADAQLAIGAANNVLRHYPLHATQLALDWAMLAVAMGTIYLPRYERWSTRRRAEATARRLGIPVPGANGMAQPQPPADNVTTLYIEPDFEPAA